MDKMEKSFENMDAIRNTCIDELPILYEIVSSVYSQFSEYLADKASSIKGFEEWQKKPLKFFSGKPIIIDNYVGDFSPYALNVFKHNGISIKTIKNTNGLRLNWKLDLTLEHYADEDINAEVSCYRQSVFNASTIIDVFYLISDTILKKFEAVIINFESAKTPKDIANAIDKSNNIRGIINFDKVLSKKVIIDLEFIFENYEFICLIDFEQVGNGTNIMYEILEIGCNN